MSTSFWKHRRAPVATRLLFASPEALKNAACSYFEWCEQNPLIAHSFRGKDNQLVQIEKLRPFTQAGLCAYIGCSRIYWHRLTDTLHRQRGPKGDALAEAVEWINAIIYEQKFSGAAAGLLHPSVIARELKYDK